MHLRRALVKRSGLVDGLVAWIHPWPRSARDEIDPTSGSDDDDPRRMLA
jgi:hypothetical protein